MPPPLPINAYQNEPINVKILHFYNSTSMIYVTFPMTENSYSLPMTQISLLPPNQLVKCMKLLTGYLSQYVTTWK